MEVEYENVPEDIRYLAQALPKLTLAEFLLTMPVIVLLAATPPVILLLLSPIPLLGAATLTGAVWFAGWHLLRAYRNFRSAPVRPGMVRMRITPDFLELKHADYCSRQAWQGIDSVQHVGEALVIIRPMNSGFIVPDRWFASKAAATAFFAAAQRYHAEAQTRKAAEPVADTADFYPAWTQSQQRLAVTYLNTPSDWTFAMKTVGSAHKSTLDYLFLFILCIAPNAGLALLALDALNGQLLKSGMRVPVHPLLAATLLVLVTLFALLANFSIMMLIRELINRRRIPVIWLIRRNLEIMPEGMVANWRLGTLAIRWAALGKIAVSAEAIYISDMQPMIAFIIPQHVFFEHDSAAEFVDRLVEWKEAADLAAADAALAPERPDDQNPYQSPQT
ncbi:hypothetical protein [Blastopirellula marina]|uniref:YcxB-like protein domain-containing protein n=1 Tax=Blastopirellula marina TaxID=124 RepID=A0A2S8G6V8_9BACT|nr:hypothetical protein [Blastopirellula marina]PQO40157.1 hypothetical protein C5Y98_06010 [Blastopirellula marina]PTL45524.1 hypothetical protein C5Y97_06010 [Blastopirellula marina]